MVSILEYFNLEVRPREPLLGEGEEPKHILRNTAVMYVGVFFGVLGKYIFTLYIPDQKFNLSLIDPMWLVISIIIAAVVFPQIYKGAKLNIEKIDPIQFFIAIQNGFFWQSVIWEIVAKG